MIFRSPMEFQSPFSAKPAFTPPKCSGDACDVVTLSGDSSWKKKALTFGLISGAVSAATMLGTIPFADKIGWDVRHRHGPALFVSQFFWKVPTSLFAIPPE